MASAFDEQPKPNAANSALLDGRRNLAVKPFLQ
jgi:hypothetical protein